jgi:nitrite reductase/ring-hydroxylating ferredoxin subunit
MSRWVDAGAIAEMKFEPGHPVKLDDAWLAVFESDGGYRVIDNACPHASAPLCDGTVLDGKVICHLHLWEFDLRTGRCDVGDEWSVRTYASRVVDGRLEVCFPD